MEKERNGQVMDRRKLKNILIIAAIIILGIAYLSALSQQNKELAQQADVPQSAQTQVPEPGTQVSQVPEEQSQAAVQQPAETNQPQAPPEASQTPSEADKTKEQENAQKPEEKPSEPAQEPQKEPEAEYRELYFRSQKLLDQHYEKHGIEMGFDSAEEYEAAACDVVNDPEALHKTEKEDGDDIYYIEATNEFVVVSKDGYIRTYFLPSSGKKYYDKQ